MPLSITACLVDLQGVPLASLEVQVVNFSASGGARPIARGKTDTQGNVSIASTATMPTDYQPRLQLQALRGTAYAEAGERTVSYTGSACDFGQLTFDSNPRTGGTSIQAQLERTIATLQAQKDAIEQELNLRYEEAMQAARDAMEEAASDSQTKIAARDAELAKKDQTITELMSELDKARADAAPETSIEMLAETTATQLRNVQTKLRSEQSGLRLGKVALQLKVLPGRADGKVALPRTRDIEKVGAGALGSLDISFHPETAAKTRSAQPRMPRVVGYTETLARRKLAQLKLGVEVMHQLVTNAEQHGRVVLQRPEPGSPIPDGTVVLIAIGRQEEYDPRPS